MRRLFDEEGRRQLRVLLPVLLGALALVPLVGGASSRLAQGGQGLVHTSLVYQLMHGQVPPHDPALAGVPAQLAWGWHLLLAGVAELLRLTPLQAALLVNALALAATVGACWSLAAWYTRRPEVRVAFALLPFVLLNPWAPLRLLWLGWRRQGTFVLAEDCCLQPLDGLQAGSGSLLARFLDFDPLPAGVALAACALLVLQRQRWTTRSRFVSGLLIGLLAALLHPTSGVGIGLMAAGAAGALLVEQLPRRPVRWGGLRRDLLPAAGLTAGLLLALPYLVLVGGSGLRPAEPGALLANLGLLGWMLVVPGVLVVVALRGHRRLSRSTRVSLGAVLALGLGALLLGHPHGDQLELVLLGAVPASVLALGLLDELVAGWRGQAGAGARIRSGLVAGLLALGLATVAANAALHLLSDQARANPWGRDGTHLVSRTHPELGAVAHLLRTRTSPRAVLVEAPPQVDDQVLSALSERATLVTRPSRYAEAHPRHPAVLQAAEALVEALQACMVSQEDVGRLRAAVPRWPDEVFAVVARPAPCLELPMAVEPAFATRTHRVYRLGR